jgi:hypothetical protein
VNENALRYVDAQLQLIELYVQRINQALSNASSTKLDSSAAMLSGLLHDLGLASRAIAGLTDRTESRHFYRLQAEWWYAAYQLARLGRLPPNIEWPDGGPHNAGDSRAIATVCREAYRRYLRRAPDAPDREDILARIYFDVQEWQ